MSKIGIKSKAVRALVVVLWAACATSAGTAAPQALTQRESDGYLQWMHSLEEAVTAREAAGLPEANLLFPFDLPAWDLDNPRPYRHLSISKAVTELESKWNSRGNGNLQSTLMALANARNYVNLSEYDSALVWYDLAARIDTSGSFRHEIAREGLACAASAKDSLAMARMMTNVLGASDLSGREGELVVAYRWLLTEQDTESLNHLVQKVESHPEILDNRLRFWHAFALDRLGRTADSLAQLRTLIRSGGLSNDLSEGQRGWVLQAVPDAYFLLGDRRLARELYTVLDACRVPRLKAWGAYQVAGLDFIDNRYQTAGAGFQAVCEGARFGSWQDQACAMAEIATEMARIKAEGKPYGVANFYRP